MQVYDLFVQLLQVLMQLAITVVVPFIVKLVIARVGLANYEKYELLAKVVVSSVEQTMGAGNGAEKKLIVANKLATMIGNKLSTDDINHLIEAAVFETKKQAEQAKQDKAEEAVQ